MGRIGEFFSDHLRVVLLVLISLVGAVIIAIAVSVFLGGDTDRSLIISDISGNVFIMKNDGQIPAVRNMLVSSGDLVVTSENSTVKLKTDNGKFIYIEPLSTVYVYYTKKTNKGSIIVNISDGSVLCRIDPKLSKKEVFEVRTPNSVHSVMGTVFHVDFNYYETLGDYTNVMLTDVRCIEGSVATQLYDTSGNKVNTQMQLMQGNAAEMLSADGHSAYNYLNQPFILTDFSETVLQELIKISAERDLPYTLADLNDAFVTVRTRTASGEPRPDPIVTSPVTESEPAVTEAPVTEPPAGTATAPPVSTSAADITTVRVTVPETSAVTSASESSAAATTTTASRASETSAVTTAATSATAASSAPAVTTAAPRTTAAPAWTTAARTTTAPAATTAPVPETTEDTAAETEVITETQAPHTVFTVPQDTTSAAPAETAAPVITEMTSGTTTPASSLNWWEIVDSENG